MKLNEPYIYNISYISIYYIWSSFALNLSVQDVAKESGLTTSAALGT